MVAKSLPVCESWDKLNGGEEAKRVGGLGRTFFIGQPKKKHTSITKKNPGPPTGTPLKCTEVEFKM